jgi:predicted SpoU family rRNA methylase
MILAVNYADKKFKRAQHLNSKTARQYGADKVIEYGPEDIDKKFYEKNKEILTNPKGGGYYLWKPYIYRKAYDELNDGDYLIYTDAGSIYVNNIKHLIDCMEREKVNIMVFSLQNEMLERKYTKRDALILTDCDSPKYIDTPQSIGGYMVYKKSPEVKVFFDEVLEYAQDIRVISDNDNVMGQPNYDDFVAHRHDQAVISLISKKQGIKRFRDPSQFGLINHYEPEVESRSTYPQIVDSHRLNVASINELKFRRTKPIMTVTKNYNRIKNKLNSWR